MTNLYERNMKLLYEYAPDVHKKVLDPEFVNKTFPTKIGFSQNQDGVIDNIAIWFEDKMYIDSSEVDVKKWVDSSINPNLRTIIIFGMGMGLQVDELITRYPDKKIVVIEPDKRIFVHAMHLRDMEKFLSNVTLWLDEDVATTKAKIYEMLTHPLARGIQFVPYILLYGEFANQILDAVNSAMNDFAVQLNTKRTLVDRWYQNRFANIVSPSVNFANFEGKFKDIPAILCGAGASLEEHIPLLKKLKKKAVIFAAGTAIDILENRGITPTFAGAIDQDPISEGGLHEHLKSDVVLIWDGQVAHNSTSFTGKNVQMLLNVNRYTGNVIDGLGLVESAPCIGNVGLDMLYKMGCSPILIVGMDLSYTNKKLYCDGTRFQEDKSDDTNCMKIVNNCGEVVSTEPSFLSMYHWFEEYASRVKPPVINCTAKGIVFKNIKWQPISDFRFDKKYDIKGIIDSCYFKNGEPDFIDIGKVIEGNDKLVAELKEIKEAVSKNQGITPDFYSRKIWGVLDDYIGTPLFLAELRCELKIKLGMKPEEAVEEFQKRRVEVVMNMADHLITSLENVKARIT